MSPQFDVTGSLAAQMWKAKTGEAVDGVVALDPVALRALVKVSGPVEVQGKQIDADNIVREILLQQYLDYAKDNPTTTACPGERAAPGAQRPHRPSHRRASLDQVDWQVADLVDDLRSAARGRHVMFWSPDPRSSAGLACRRRLRRAAPRRL